MLDPSKSSETAEKTSSLLRLLRKSSRRHAGTRIFILSTEVIKPFDFLLSIVAYSS